MQGSITLAGYTFTADEWSKVKADLCDMDRAGNDQFNRANARPDDSPGTAPVNDNAAAAAPAHS